MARTLNATTVYRAALSAGFSPADAVIATQVAFLESGWNPDATHKNRNGTTDYGLMQINSVHTDILTNGSWNDPVANMRMAKAVKDKQGWGAWVTYKNRNKVRVIADPSTGKITFTPPSGKPSSVQAQEPGGAFKNLGPLDSAAESLHDALNPLDSVRDLIGKVSNPGLWTRIGIGWLGFVLVFLGILFLFWQAKDKVAGTVVGSVVKGATK